MDIRGIIPDRFSRIAIEACTIAFDLYEKDYHNPQTKYQTYAYPKPEYFRDFALVRTREAARQRIIEEVMCKDDRPLWILVWGSMGMIGDTLKVAPGIADKIRVLTIATFLRAKENGGNGTMGNWNSWGRQYVYDNFPKLWWVESDWIFIIEDKDKQYPLPEF